MPKSHLIAVIAAIVVTSCGGSDTGSATPATSTAIVATTSTSGLPVIAPSPTVALSPSSTTSTTAPTLTALPQPSTTTTPPIFTAVVSEITAGIEARMTSSWREGCPVGLDGLAHIELTHWNFEGEAVIGELIVAAEHAADIVEVFGRLFDGGYPIQRMELVDAFDSDDNLSMAANNTSAFNCREVAWSPGVWSRHAFGRAIDVNPLVNPYVSATRLLPPEGAEYADRTLDVPGLIGPDDLIVQAFADIGWRWGGFWNSAKDYQHFDCC